MPYFQFLVTITAGSREDARDELTGSLADAKDSGVIQGYDVDDINAEVSEARCASCETPLTDETTAETMYRHTSGELTHSPECEGSCVAAPVLVCASCKENI